MHRVLLLGGYGVFGARIAERLARESGLELIVAGRSLERALGLAAEVGKNAQARITAARLDAMEVKGQALADLRAQVVINASGPYQWQDHRLARACIAAGAHYIDLADARQFVNGIAALEAEARAADVLLVSGASTLPALSAAVIDAYAPRFSVLEAARIVIAPGNSFDPGLATTQSILGTLGRPFAAAGGKLQPAIYGWQNLRRETMLGLGARWLGACETPDLDLLPRRYPSLNCVEVFAALEVGAFHLGLWGLSWLVRGGLMRKPERLARPLLRVKRALRFLGSDVGGMAIILRGRNGEDAPQRVAWHLVARRGHGPYIPTIASMIVAKGLIAGTLHQRGAMPCLGLFTLTDFLGEVADLDIVAAET
ncbi:MAG: saccharopine dehydrogenase NADP-binding domain-containing protein [Hyphomicrobiaceae bacterium]|nr:saccharopine dehydrogenase NADP-binding domain-containing protein [Hyphomicrobiaceae bacterium]